MAECHGADEWIVDLPSSGRPTRSATSELTGKIQGSTDDGCIWLVTDEDSSRVPLLWPSGWRVRVRPHHRTKFTVLHRRLRNRDLQAGIYFGTRLRLVGYYETVGPDDECMLGKSKAFRIVDTVFLDADNLLPKGVPPPTRKK